MHSIYNGLMGRIYKVSKKFGVSYVVLFKTSDDRFFGVFFFSEDDHILCTCLGSGNPHLGSDYYPMDSGSVP